jgi:hypothetical protein
MLRDGWPAHWHDLGQSTHRARTAPQLLKDLAPGGIGKGGKRISVSHDLL